MVFFCIFIIFTFLVSYFFTFISYLCSPFMEDLKKTNKGLTASEVVRQREQYGENVLTPPAKTSLWKLYIEKYNDPIIQILLVAAAFSLVLAVIENEYVETIGIILAIFFATTIGFWFERDAARRFSDLTAMDDEAQVKVVRDGIVTLVHRREVVVGDLVLIETGDEIPADGRLVDSRDLQVNESSLTGEMMAEKESAPNSSRGGRDTERDETYPRNMVLRSTMVMSGSGMFEVTAVGDGTEIGKVATSSTEQTQVKTPLNIQLDRLAKTISKVGTAVSVAAFLIFLVHDILTNDAVWHSTNYLAMIEVVLKYFMMAVTLIVMAVPEGLPMAVTLALALNMRRMLKSNNLVRKLHACETMGAVTVICTDKTGTLTENRMTVVEMRRTKEEEHGNSEDLFKAIALNTTAHLDGDTGIGNPTEQALLRWMEGQGADYRKIRDKYTITARQPFSTERKFMMTEAGGTKYFKGAPEIILDMCDIGKEERLKAEEKLREWQEKGMRTLAFAVCSAPVPSGFPVQEIPRPSLQAVCAINDPVRRDVPDAVTQCVKAGIQVKIVTGDTSATALEIARVIGIIDARRYGGTGVRGCENTKLAITGLEFAALSDEEAYKRAGEICVMSRARPTDKQRLVEMLQKRGEIVAVTGDGTNDAPALHHAHVGLSLGSGTSVAKEASDMTLLDDSFRSIVHAVMWGRSLYKNIQRFLYFQLVVNVAALLLVLAGSVIGTEMPLTVTQILWVNLIMDTFAAMALASLPPSREVLNDAPRNRDEFIITPKIGRHILGTGIFFFVAMLGMFVHCLYDEDPGIQRHELSLFFTTFVMLQFWNLLNAKALNSYHSVFHRLWADRGLLLVMAFILIGQWLIVTFGGNMFRTDPLSFQEWAIIISTTSVVVWIRELYRLCKG